MKADNSRADIERRKFIEDCLQYDIPRLQLELYPSGVDVRSDIVYQKDLKYDIYIPEAVKSKGECFILTHGGAFVYGSKELDKCFGMHLALRSGLPVINVDYTLMPNADLQEQLREILSAVDNISYELKLRKIHTVGDSAGGYLAMILSILINSEDARKACSLELRSDIKAGSSNLICGMYKTCNDIFPGVYFDPDMNMPHWIYDLSEAIKIYGCPKTVLVTGDLDFLEKDNTELEEKIRASGIPVKFYDAVSTEERKMYHVFPISNPAWPEGVKTINMITENAVGE